MNKFRKPLAMLLCIVLCFSLLSTAAFADEEQETGESAVPADTAGIIDGLIEETPPAEKNSDVVAYENEETFSAAAVLEETGEASFSASVSAADGQCGDNVYWFKDESGQVTVVGSGPMWDYYWKGDNITPFEGDETVTAVVVRSGVTTVGAWLFDECCNLAAVSLPDTLTSIGVSAFRSTGLTSLTIPESVVSIDEAAFADCTCLTDVSIADGVEISLDERAFYGCTGLSSMSIPVSVVSVGEAAFADCSGLRTATVAGALTVFGNDVFTGCAADFTMYGCAGSTAESYAEANDIPFVVIRFIIDSGSLSDDVRWALCDDGTLIVSGTGQTPSYISEDKNPLGSSAVTAAVVEEGITGIGNYLFVHCPNLGSVSIPDSVTLIGMSAFRGTSLTDVTVPAGVTDIRTSAFHNCAYLEEIRFLGAPPAISSGAFTNVTAKAYYPADKGWTDDDLQDFGGNLTWILNDPTNSQSAWKALQSQIPDSGTVTLKLTQNVIAGKDDTSIVIPTDAIVTLDLNGYQIDRGLGSADDNGSVFVVRGTLVVESGADGGQITGGYTKDGGGGVFIESGGVFRLKSGSIANNQTDGSGAGIWVRPGGTFNMLGGSVTANHSTDTSGGVHNVGSFTMSGGSITSNTVDQNVYPDLFTSKDLSLSGSAFIGNITFGYLNDSCPKLNIQSQLTAKDKTRVTVVAPPNVTLPESIPFTSGWAAASGGEITDHFICDLSGYELRADKDGEGAFIKLQNNPENADRLILDPDTGIWYYGTPGEVNESFTGFVDYGGGRFYVVNGLLSAESNGLTYVDGVWYFLSQGQLQMVTQWAEYDGYWFYITDGILDTAKNGLMEYNDGLFLVAAGQIRKNENGLWHNEEALGGDGSWVFLANGQVQSQYTGLAQYDGEWFYVVDGILAENYIGWVYYNGSRFYVIHGMVK